MILRSAMALLFVAMLVAQLSHARRPADEDRASGLAPAAAADPAHSA